MISNNIIQFKAGSNDAVSSLTETDLKYIWHERFVGDRTIKTDSGDSLMILFPGRWNRGPGPDFLGARLVLEGKEIIGDVEIHRTPEEWYQHLHHVDSAYNNVKLHFSLTALKPERIRNAAGKLIPQVFPETIFTKEQLKVITDYRSGTYCLTPYWENLECRCDFKSADLVELKEYFTSVGMERIQNKVERFRNRILKVGYDQVIYEGLFESAGYVVNKHQFLFLAASLDMKRMREILQWTPGSDRMITSEALLLGAARLLPNQSKERPDLDLEGSLRARELEMKWRKIRHIVEDVLMETGSIRMAGQMPLSSPSRTIAGIAHFISENFEKNLFDLFYSKFLDCGNALSKFSTFVSALLNGSIVRFWSGRMGFTASGTGRNMVFGRDKVNRFTGNILVPVFLHHTHCKNERKITDNLIKYAGELNAADNCYTKFIFKQLPDAIRRRLNLSFVVEQGIIAHYSANCSESRCFDCPLRDKK